jgi:hypothetical protein
MTRWKRIGAVLLALVLLLATVDAGIAAFAGGDPLLRRGGLVRTPPATLTASYLFAILLVVDILLAFVAARRWRELWE